MEAVFVCHLQLWTSIYHLQQSFYCIFWLFWLLLFRNGDTYAGEYFADKMHGFGVYRFANGHRYEGAWHEGRRQGLGMYTFRNGETQSGHWQNGILDVPSTQNTTYPVSPVAVYHSKVLNAVQVVGFSTILSSISAILCCFLMPPSVFPILHRVITTDSFFYHLHAH